MLDTIFGARVHALAQGSNALEAARERAHALAQAPQFGCRFRQVIVPNGSAGTQAGPAAGFELLGRGARTVRGYCVLADLNPTQTATLELTRSTLALFGHHHGIEDDALDLNGTHRGNGYGIPTDEMISAVKLPGETEGLLVDPHVQACTRPPMLWTPAS